MSTREADSYVVKTLKEMMALWAGPWNLPIEYEISGDKLIARFSMEVQADLNKTSIEQAKRDIEVLFRNAILTHSRGGAIQ